jgi:23S rRNA pseudouridine2605 synthase
VFEKLPSIGNGKWISVGRLDYNTEGLLLFTNSGELANRLMHPRYEVEREYAVRVMGRLTDEQQQRLTTGVELDDGTARCDVVEDGGGDEDASNHWYRVVLREGRNREVRRLFEALPVMVSRLIRTRYGAVAMPKSVKRGDVMELDPAAVGALLESAGLGSRGTGNAPGRGRDQRNESRGSPKDGRRHGPPSTQPHAKGHSHPRPPGESGPPSPGSAGPRPHFKSGKPGFRPHGKGGPRPPGPMGPMAGNGQGPGAETPHRKPPRESGNFDEIQPQSNANASPFATTRMTKPGGYSRGADAHGAPRHRSGPRAQAASFGAHPKGPGGGFSPRHARRPDKPRTEVNGNVAPKGEPPPPSDDES